MTDFLLIAHHEQRQLSVVNAQTFAIVEPLTLPGRAAVLGVSSDHRYGFVVHRDDHCISLIDGHTATLQATIPTDEQPTHFHAENGQVVIFNDGSGSISVFDERDLSKPPQTYPTGKPDHGSALIIDSYLLAGHLRRGSVDVYRIGEAEPIQHFDCCPILHGATQHGTTGIFGCGDGVLLLKKNGDQFDAVKLDNPTDTPPRTRVGLFAKHPNSAFVLGNFGNGLALIDPEAATMQILPLPAHPLKFSFDTTGNAAIVLTNDGVLHRLDLPSGEISASNAIVAAVASPKGPDGKARPTFTLADDRAYVVEPEANRLIVIDLATLAPIHTLDLPENPSAIVALKSAH